MFQTQWNPSPAFCWTQDAAFAHVGRPVRLGSPARGVAGGHEEKGTSPGDAKHEEAPRCLESQGGSRQLSALDFCWVPDSFGLLCLGGSRWLLFGLVRPFWDGLAVLGDEGF